MAYPTNEQELVTRVEREGISMKKKMILQKKN